MNYLNKYDTVMNTIVDYTFGVVVDEKTNTWLKETAFFQGLPLSLITSIVTTCLFRPVYPFAAIALGTVACVSYNIGIATEMKVMDEQNKSKLRSKRQENLPIGYILAWGAISTLGSAALLKLAFQARMTWRNSAIVSVVSIVSNIWLRSFILSKARSR